MENIDALVSATTSPHYTLTVQQLRQIQNPPKVAVDLAVPRDIDPECGQVITLYDTDSLGSGGPGSPDELEAMRSIAAQELERFAQWQRRQEITQKTPKFPLFIDLSGQKVVLVGGGTIAARRISTLRLFGCEITVIAPELKCSPEGLAMEAA